jgi:hypothetical protein
VSLNETVISAEKYSAAKPYNFPENQVSLNETVNSSEKYSPDKPYNFPKNRCL